MTNSDFIELVNEQQPDLTKPDIRALLDSISAAMVQALQDVEEGDRVPVLPGYLAVYTKHNKARPPRPGRSPFTGETIMFKAKPAFNTIKTAVRKKLKDAV